MNRLELIKVLARKRAIASDSKPRGVFANAHPEQATRARQRDTKRTSGVLLRGSWGPINRPAGLRYDWVKAPDPKTGAFFKVGARHEPHALTRIAEKWLHGPKQRAKVAP